MSRRALKGRYWVMERAGWGHQVARETFLCHNTWPYPTPIPCKQLDMRAGRLFQEELSPVLVGIRS